MPMYYPDLKSVKSCAEAMTRQPNANKRYFGPIPETEEDLPKPRIMLGLYFRNTWNDVIAAMEIELAVTKENYEELMAENVMKQFMR